MNAHSYYANNETYTTRLSKQRVSFFEKYSDFIIKYSSPSDYILDVGCGPGIALEMIQQHKTDRKLFGVEVSKPSVELCRSKGLECSLYEGHALPFSPNMFDVVGSIDVLEHTEDPEKFLDEQLRILKTGGHLIIVCPNFLSVTNSYHHHTKGLVQKIRNIGSLTRRCLLRKPLWEKMKTVSRFDFKPDDDACNVTNPIDLYWWARKKGLVSVYSSCQTSYHSGIRHHLDLPLLRLLFGSSFLIFKKV